MDLQELIKKGLTEAEAKKLLENGEYWKERFASLEDASHKQGVETFYEIEKQYKLAIRNVENDLSRWYSRYATENGINLTEAKKILNAGELDAFKMDVKDYIAKGESLDPRYFDELEKASVKVHVSRLESLKVQLQNQIENVTYQTNDAINKMASRVFSEQYYKATYEIQRGLGVGWDVMRLDQRRIDKVITKPWTVDGLNFSDRIWNNRCKLINEVHTQLTQGIIRGSDPKKAINVIAKRMEVSKSQAGRLVMTENAFFHSAATQEVLKDLEVEKYEILATLDSQTSELCRGLDGKVFKRSEYEVGVTAPPFHPWCRTTTIPYFDDVYDFPEYRAARGGESGYYTIPSKMKYQEWFDIFVNKGSKKKLEVVNPLTALLKIDTACSLFQNYGQDHYEAMHNALVKSGEEDMVKIWAQCEPNLGIIDIDHQGTPAFYRLDEGIRINLAKDAKGSRWQKPYQTSFHELGHNIDFLLNGKTLGAYYSDSYKNGLFAKTIREEIQKRLDDIGNELKKGLRAAEDKGRYLYDKGLITDTTAYFIKEGIASSRYKKAYAYKYLENELRAIPIMERSAISDIVEGATDANVRAGFGHGKQYWRDRPNVGLPREAFAEMWESIVNKGEWEILKQYLPESTKLFKQMLKDAIK